MKLGILCPGQGTQNLTMLEMIKDNAIARDILLTASDVLKEDLFKLDESKDIFKNSFAQPYICAVQIATYHALKDLIPAASVFAGYSLGELSLYGCNGSLSPEKAIELAKKRAEHMDKPLICVFALSICSALFFANSIASLGLNEPLQPYKLNSPKLYPAKTDVAGIESFRAWYVAI